MRCDSGQPSGVHEGHLAALRDALLREGLGETVELVPADCLGACGEPTALALQDAGRATYLFAGVSPVNDIEDIVSTCRLYLSSPEGRIVDARPCGRLRFCLKGRIPALPAG
nr:DUF1636 family protein [Stappia stellulata]